MIAMASVKDPEKLQQYFVGVQKAAAPYGAELLFRGKTNRLLNNHDSAHDLVVVVRFPNAEKIDEWYDSKEYQSLIPLRDEGADVKMTSYVGMS